VDVTSSTAISYASARPDRTLAIWPESSSLVCTRRLVPATVVMRGASATPSSASTARAGSPEVFATLERVNSEPPRNSMPGLSPRTPRTANESAIRVSAIVNQSRRFATIGKERAPV